MDGNSAQERPRILSLYTATRKLPVASSENVTLVVVLVGWERAETTTTTAHDICLFLPLSLCICVLSSDIGIRL